MSKSDKNVRDGFMNQSKASSILPSPAMLESYEEIAPGIVDKLVNLVEKEQKHRHALEEKSIKCKIIVERYKELFEKIASALIAILILLISFLIAKINIFAGMLSCALCYGFLFAKRKCCNVKGKVASGDNKSKQFNNNYNKQNFRRKVRKTL